MGKLDGKVALVTGAARGQGRVECITLAREGADIAALDICHDLSYPNYPLGTEEQLNETVAEVKKLGRRAIALKADVSQADEVEAAVDRTIEEFGRIDILVNNAGIAGFKPTIELTEEEWDTMMAINLKGVWLCCKYVVPHMIAQKSGKIISTSSVAGLKAIANIGHYVAAKHGVVGLTRTLAIELAEHNINVNSIHPGTTDTPMLSSLSEELGMTPEQMAEAFTAEQLFTRVIDPQDQANAVLWLASEDSRFVTGHQLPVDGGWMTK